MTGKETNADRIRNMSDEYLMNTVFDRFLERIGIDECPFCLLFPVAKGIKY